MFRDDYKYEMIKDKVAANWMLLKHVPEARQTKELCMIALEQNWRALDLIINVKPDLCLKTWELTYDFEEDTKEIFDCVMRNMACDSVMENMTYDLYDTNKVNKITSNYIDKISKCIDDKTDKANKIKEFTTTTKHNTTTVFYNVITKTTEIMELIKFKIKNIFR